MYVNKYIYFLHESEVLQKYPVAYEEPRSCLLFDPDEHPGNTLKAFNKFIQCFQLW